MREAHDGIDPPVFAGAQRRGRASELGEALARGMHVEDSLRAASAPKNPNPGPPKARPLTPCGAWATIC